jgi:hypothetical protein
MDLELKRISTAAIPSALRKAEQYRLLNEPALAESICRDILAVDDAHEAARITLLLSLTDQFDARSTEGVKEAEALLSRLAGDYERAYYCGLISERWGRALLAAQDPGGQAYEWLTDAMHHYEHAEALAPAGNEDPLLRWNTCVREIESRRLQPRAEIIDGGDEAPAR